MRRLFLLLTLLALWTSSKAQVRVLQGLVVFNSNKISGVLIKDISIHSQAISDEIGQFKIRAQSGDTVLSVKDGYINDTLLIANQEYMLVYLRKKAILLNEVKINSMPITPEETYANDKKEYKLIYFNGDNKGIFFSGSLVNIDKLNNALGKKGHDARGLQRDLTKDYKDKIVDRRFNPLAATITGYKNKQLADFILNNRPSYDEIIKFTDYDIINYIKKKLSETKSK